MITKRFVCGKGLWYFLCLSLCMTGCGKQPETFLTAQEEEEPSPGASPLAKEPTFSPSPVPVEPSQKELLYVDVCGAVVYPGVYSLEQGSRVFSAIDAAGGFAADAATSAINQALPLEDGAQLYVPTLEEVTQTEQSSSQGLGGVCSENPVSVCQYGSDADFVASSASQSRTKTGSSGEEEKIDINHADVSQIEQINGIGPSKARAIVEYRETAGPYTCPEDLLNVSGIGAGTLEKIKEQILVN